MRAHGAAERGEPATKGERDGKQPHDVDADRLGHAGVVDCSAQFCSKIGPFERVPERDHEHGSHGHDEDPIDLELLNAEVDIFSEQFRQGCRERIGPERRLSVATPRNISPMVKRT